MLRFAGVLILVSMIVAQLGCGGSPASGLPSSGSPVPPPPAPNISLSPTSAVAGSPDLTLTITGSHFAFTSVSHEFNQVVWSANGSDTSLATFVSSTQLTAVIPTALLTSGTQAKVRVEIWDIPGDAPQDTSSSVAFSMTKTPVGKFSVSSISPASAIAGGSDLQLTVIGSNFLNANLYNTVVLWSANGHDTFLPTAFVSGTQLTALIPAALLMKPITAKVSVQIYYFADDIPTSVSNSVSFAVVSSANE